MSEHQCGPEYAKPFFDSVKAAIVKNSANKQYYIACVDHETDIIGIEFDKSVGITSAFDGGLETRFESRESIKERNDLVPYKWLGARPISFLETKNPNHTDFGGPDRHASLFREFERIGRTFPEDAKKYALVSRAYYSESLGLKGDDDVAEGTIRDGKVYHKISPGSAFPASCECCTWDDETGNCNGTWCDE